MSYYIYVMEVHKRKIQSFAKYSYAVTLPIHWIKAHNLDKTHITEENNDELDENHANSQDPTVTIYELSDGSLQLFPYQHKLTTSENIARFELDDLLRQNPRFIEEKGIQLLLISYYMNGAAGVEVLSKSPLPQTLIDQIERTQNRLLFNWNLNRVSEYHVVIKNILSEAPENIFQEDIPQYLRESFSIILWMLEDILSSLEQQEYSPLAEIDNRDMKIDRYYFFIVRQIRTIFEVPQISRPLHYSHKKLIDLRIIAKLIEDVGDSLKSIAGILSQLHQFITQIHLREFLIDYFKQLLHVYSQLADLLRRSVLEHNPKVGLNIEVMQMIQEFRAIGKALEDQWHVVGPELKLVPDRYNFLDYYQGAKLIEKIENVFKKIFDFTNVFF